MSGYFIIRSLDDFTVGHAIHSTVAQLVTVRLVRVTIQDHEL